MRWWLQGCIKLHNSPRQGGGERIKEFSKFHRFGQVFFSHFSRVSSFSTLYFIKGLFLTIFPDFISMDEFSIVQRIEVWIRNFKFSIHSAAIGYDSFLEKRVYESHMTHNICNIHIIWFQILFLIQWCKNFWDSPTQNFSIIFFSRMRGRNKILTSNSNSA